MRRWILNLLLVVSIFSVGQFMTAPLTFAQTCTATSQPQTANGTVNLTNDTCLKDPNYAYSRLGPLISLILTLALIAGAVTAFFFLVIGAIQWGISKNDASAMSKARNTMIYAFDGLLLLGMVYVIIVFFNNIFPHA